MRSGSVFLRPGCVKMQGNEGARTFSGRGAVSHEGIGRRPGDSHSRTPKQLAAPAEDALSSCALQRPVACEANPVLGEAQGTMRTQVSETAHTSDNRWRIYEALKRIAAAEAITPAGYEACLAAITEELGL